MARTLNFTVKPNARQSVIHALPDGTYRAELKAQPVDGKANEELIRLVAEFFKVRKAQVSIKSGAAGRSKRIVIED